MKNICGRPFQGTHYSSQIRSIVAAFSTTAMSLKENAILGFSDSDDNSLFPEGWSSAETGWRAQYHPTALSE